MMMMTTTEFIGAFINLRKASSSPSVCTELGTHWTDFYEIWYLSIFRKFVENLQVWLKSDKSNGYFTRWLVHIYNIISLNSSYNEKFFRQKLYRKSKHTFLCSITFSESSTVCETMWKNMVEPGSPQITQYGPENMRFTSRIKKEWTHTLIIFNNYPSSTATMTKRKHLSVTL